ncbi:hypothetical protein [uncultured Shewanella sp.]|uniref:hypothetical protein n=1 Tax=uncultured Shewanella sp. TaxID=173975 RepID=UPI002635B459|nr:hypothetical protein [uncultured Shewanella sp.]
MTNRIPLTLKNSLWLVFSLWLISLQFITFAHSMEHALEHDNTHCLYSNIYHHHHAGPSTVSLPSLCEQQTENIRLPSYQQPTLLWTHSVNVRAPPF